jgi:O-antigen/teichoic acid export membrane protein
VTRPVVRLIVSIDTEEDNWKASRSGITTTNIERLPPLQRRFEGLGVRPTYFTAYQIVIAERSADIMREIARGGRAEIGAHLHPWNTPPLLPEMRTMLLNVPADLQRQKLRTLTEALTASLGIAPTSFRAGRFGLGHTTVRALIDAGYRVDSSVTPFFSWEAYDNGPSFLGAPMRMYRLNGAHDVRVPAAGPLVEVPLSCGFHRGHPDAWATLWSVIDAPLGRRIRLPSVVNRLGIGRRIILSPEPHELRDLTSLSRALMDGGLPYLQVFWHSSSLMPGLTPFCRTDSDVDRMLRKFEDWLAWLDREATIRFVTISEAVAETMNAESPGAAGDVASSAAAFAGGTARAQTTAPPERPSIAEVTPSVGDPGDAAAAASSSSVGRHTTIYLAGIVIGRAVGLVMLPFYTRYLTPAEYGIMQLVEMTLDVISIMAGTRIASGIHRYYYKAENDRDRNAVLSTAMALLTVSFLAFGALIFALAEPLTRLVLGTTDYTGLMRIAAITFALQSLLLVPFGIIQLWQRSVLFTVLSTVKLLIQLTLNVVFLAVIELGVISVFLSTLIANVLIGAGLTWMIVRQIGFSVSGGAARSLLRYGLPLVWTQFAMFFVTYGDRYFLRVSTDVGEVGLYSLAYQFGFIVVSVGFLPFSLVWEPLRFAIANDPDRDAQYSRAFLFMNVLQGVATVGCALFVRDFIIVMSDPAYHTAYLIVPVILGAYLLQSWAYFHEVGILVRERTSYVTLANYVAAVVALVGYAVLIPRWLGWGAAITTFLAFLARWIVTYVIAQRLLRVRYDWAPVRRSLALIVVFVVIGVALPHPSVTLSVVMRSVLMVAYLVALWHANVISAADKARIVEAARAPRRAAAILLGRG